MSSLQKLGLTILVTLLVVFGIYRFGFNKGWGQRDAEMQAEIALKNEESRAKEQVAAEKLAATSNQLLEVNNALDQKSSALDRAIRAGRVRLPTASCVPPAQDTAAPSGNRDEAPSESDRQTLSLIAAIAADGDRAINQLNACIDAYNQVKDQLNGDR